MTSTAARLAERGLDASCSSARLFVGLCVDDTETDVGGGDGGMLVHGVGGVRGVAVALVFLCKPDITLVLPLKNPPPPTFHSRG